MLMKKHIAEDMKTYKEENRSLYPLSPVFTPLPYIPMKEKEYKIKDLGPVLKLFKVDINILFPRRNCIKEKTYVVGCKRNNERIPE
jgi:hypothetical protein